MQQQAGNALCPVHMTCGRHAAALQASDLAIWLQAQLRISIPYFVCFTFNFMHLDLIQSHFVPVAQSQLSQPLVSITSDTVRWLFQRLIGFAKIRILRAGYLPIRPLPFCEWQIVQLWF